MLTKRPPPVDSGLREVAPSDYGGVMVTDRGRSYDAQALSGVKQQKCLAHVLRSISEVVQTKRGRGRSFGNRLSRLLREAMELRQAYHRGEASDFAAEAERLRREASYHLRDRPMSDADNWRLQNELGWHDDRGNQKWLRKSEQGDKWNRCLIEGMIVLSETGARDEQTTPP